MHYKGKILPIQYSTVTLMPEIYSALLGQLVDLFFLILTDK